jgi:hypothetical protein
MAKNAWWPDVGQTYRDPTSGTVVLVITAPRLPGVLRCDGAAMIAARPLPCSYQSRTGITVALRPGWRYSDPLSGLVVRCLRGGHGHLSYAGRALTADLAAR